MILGEAGDLLGTWQYAERYLGGGTRAYSPFSTDLDVPDLYHPQVGADRFTVPTFVVPRRHGVFLHGHVRSAVAQLYRRGDAFLLPVHPATLTHRPLPGWEVLYHAERGPELSVVPAANTRTVFVERIDGVRVEPHFVKMHYPKRLSRFVRTLGEQAIRTQLWTYRELERAGLPVLTEAAGGVLGTSPDTAWGFLIRELHPRGGTTVGPGRGMAGRDIATDPPHHTVPLFALYGRDVRRPHDPTLMEQLIARGSEAPARWLARRVVVPMVRLWLRAVLKTGCAPELHGQNTLFSFDPDGGHTAVLFRDCDLFVDPATREAGGPNKGLPPVSVIGQDVREPVSRVFSLVYDSYMAHHALDRLAQVAADRLGVPTTHLHQAARETFTAHGGRTLPFPDTVFYYENQLLPDDGWRLRDTGATPTWRTPPTAATP
ncbi:ferric iron reductase [Streptomyces sp. NPDC091377]|uniref:ferric iron reductase n=1 Tax=Streptomyces sp. NPDC091377 TaxID=3365995 RepID=UPI0038014E52